ILTRYGCSDELYRIAAQRTFPSWGYWMEQGATTLWQNWDGSQSRNHIMFGSIESWFYRGLAGIRPDENHPGFENVIISPAFINGLNEVKGSYQSCRGLIKSEWEKRGKEIKLRVYIPANSSGKIILPFEESEIQQLRIGDEIIWENDKVLNIKIPGVEYAGIEGDKVSFEVCSGEHQFEIILNQG